MLSTAWCAAKCSPLNVRNSSRVRLRSSNHHFLCCTEARGTFNSCYSCAGREECQGDRESHKKWCNKHQWSYYVLDSGRNWACAESNTLSVMFLSAKLPSLTKSKHIPIACKQLKNVYLWPLQNMFSSFLHSLWASLTSAKRLSVLTGGV